MHVLRKRNREVLFNWFHLIVNCSNFWFEFRDLVCNHIPYNVIIYRKIPVNNLIAESCHEFPWDLRVISCYFFRNILCCLTNNFQCSCDGVFFYLIRLEFFIGKGFTYRMYQMDLIKNMDEVDPAILQSRSPRAQPGTEYTYQYPQLSGGPPSF